MTMLEKLGVSGEQLRGAYLGHAVMYTPLCGIAGGCTGLVVGYAGAIFAPFVLPFSLFGISAYYLHDKHDKHAAATTAQASKPNQNPWTKY